ncbi:hypothetical protein FSP39_003634 [Pinctada imbricata]|uniref:General transcription factor IIF subunit 2 n=1 Tax=Pinctada imbricata TaxID=66713 RepID=A0AA88Y7X7_PINIB|nr:hypothetical protein FSP39_003634 [Pinctada imbricata]
MSVPQNVEKAHEAKAVELGAAGRGVWLVKVPKYLSEKWKKAPASCEVGQMKITRSKFPGKKPDVVFSLDESLAKAGPGETACPREHRMVLTGLGNQNLVIFSETPVMVKSESSTGVVSEVASERLGIEGKVIQRADCRPEADNNYLKLKRLQLEARNKPQREVKQLDTVVHNYKPIPANFNTKDKSKEVAKRQRAEKEQVMDLLFKAFEKHQYYNVKDLVNITKQPITYLKEILKEICVYNMKAPHRNMWELKPEYRHYKDGEQAT